MSSVTSSTKFFFHIFNQGPCFLEMRINLHGKKAASMLTAHLFLKCRVISWTCNYMVQSITAFINTNRYSTLAVITEIHFNSNWLVSMPVGCSLTTATLLTFYGLDQFIGYRMNSVNFQVIQVLEQETQLSFQISCWAIHRSNDSRWKQQ